MDLHLRTDSTGAVPVLLIDGDVDLATLPRLRNALARLVVDRSGQLVVADLSAVTSLDDCGLGVLMGAAAHARGTGGDLALVCRPGRLRERLSLSGLDRAMTVADALHAVA